MPDYDRARPWSIQTVQRKLFIMAGAAAFLFFAHMAQAQESPSESPGLPESGATSEPARESSKPENPAPEQVNTSPDAGQAKELIEIIPEKTVKRIVLSGPLVPNETRTARVYSKFEGTVERAFGGVKGKRVQKGQPLLVIVSPGFVSIQQELLRARKVKDTLAETGFEEIGQNSTLLYQATRERLRLWDISDEQMRRIEESGAPEKTLTIESPIDGFIVFSYAAKGLRVVPGLELYTISDLSTIWMLAEVGPQDLPSVQVGQSAAITLGSFPGATFSGKVSFIYPESNATTHMMLIRLECTNRELKLKPGMEARAEIKKDLGMKITVPADAVLESEGGQIVFVAGVGDQEFESRRVKTGARLDDRIIIESGLNPGEKILATAKAPPDQKEKQP